jgi:MYXO-CTERM domain-containing protein
VPPPAPGAPKEERDAYGTYPNTLTGDNFVVKWGRSGGISEDEAEELLDAFEYAWEREVEELAFPAPAGTDRYLFNVYIGDTGDGAPDGYGTSGYFNRDNDNYPMIVVSAATLSDMSWARGTAAHEFFHAVQDVTGRWDYTGDSAWYWEATAMWIEGEVLEGYEEYVAFLYGYALLPHLPVYFFDYPDTGALQEYHQYGAMIFPRYISEHAADVDVIRDSWVEDLGEDTPQDAIAALLADRGIDFDDAFGDFAARNAVWDYADGELYAEWIDWYADYFRSDDHRVVAEVSTEGTDGLVDAPAETLPQRLGYNHIVLERPGDTAWRIRFEGVPEGSEESDAAWRVTVVEDAPGGPVYTGIDLVDGMGEVLVGPVDGALTLVVAAVPARGRDEETFSYAYAFTPEAVEEPTDTGDPLDSGGGVDELKDEDTGGVTLASGCGCNHGGGGHALFGAFAAAALALRRRR